MKNYFKKILSEKFEINAGWAFFVIAIFYIGFLVGYVLAGFFVLVLALLDPRSTNSLDIHTLHLYQAAYLKPTILFEHVIGLIFMVGVAKRIFANLLKDRSTIGAAWVSGSTKNIFISVFLGTVFAVTYVYINNVFYGNIPQALHFWQFITEEKSIDFRIILIIVLIDCSILTPIIEELMFRGIILAGFNKSFGTIWGCILTTISFVLFHDIKLLRLDFLISILCIAIALLLIRLRTRAIGPAIAFHISYNLVNFICM